MSIQTPTSLLLKQSALLPVFIIIPILIGLGVSDYNSVTQHMSEMELGSVWVRFIDQGSTVAAGLSVCLFGVGCLWLNGAFRWSFTCLVALLGGLGMASNGIFAMGTPLHGLYGMPIFLIFVPAFFVAEFSGADDTPWFRNISLAISFLSLMYIWMLLVGLDPPHYRGLTQRVGSLLTFGWYTMCVMRVWRDDMRD